MPVNFKNKKPETKKSGGKPQKMGITPPWMKRGAQARTVVDRERKRAEQQREQNSKLFRFFMKPGEKCYISFLDGDLDEDGLLDVPVIYEHGLKQDGRWTQYTCVQEQEPCPLCQADNKPYMVALLTVIDHREYHSNRTNTTYKDTPKIFPAKRMTLDLLQAIAEKRKGLAGCTFEVTRTGDRDPAVGNMFDYEDKNPVKDLTEQFGEKCVPANFVEEIAYYTADQLVEMGLGVAVTGIKSGYDDTGGLEEQL